MHRDGAFYYHIRILLCGVKVVVFAVEFIEAHLNTSTARKFLFDGASVSRVFPSCVVLTLYLIFVGLNEFSNHVPQQMHLVGLT